MDWVYESPCRYLSFLNVWFKFQNGRFSKISFRGQAYKYWAAGVGGGGGGLRVDGGLVRVEWGGGVLGGGLKGQAYKYQVGGGG